MLSFNKLHFEARGSSAWMNFHPIFCTYTFFLFTGIFFDFFHEYELYLFLPFSLYFHVQKTFFTPTFLSIIRNFHGHNSLFHGQNWEIFKNFHVRHFFFMSEKKKAALTHTHTHQKSKCSLKQSYIIHYVNFFDQ